MFWRLVLAGVATLPELHREWTLEDILDAHEALDAKEALERHFMERAKREARREAESWQAGRSDD